MTDPKVGADDYIHGTGATGDDIGQLPRVELDVPMIETDDQDLPRLAAAAWAALEAANKPPQFFRWAGNLARIERDDNGGPVGRPLTPDRLRHHLARVADWRQRRGDQLQRVYPPMPVVRDLLARPNAPLPVLEQITETPVFTPSGRLHATAGYDPESRVIYAPPSGFVVPQVPSAPTPADVTAARELVLKELLGEFPFVGAADLAHVVAFAITLFVRPLIKGPVPLILVEKPTPGTGASLLVAALARVATGRDPGTMSEGQDEDEWRKRITSTLMGSPAIAWIDNLRRRLDSAALSAAITAEYWTDRVLGRSEMVHLPVRCAWIATGNNPVLSPELARRTVSCRLDARRDRPWERHAFRHPDLLAWVDASRPALVRAFLVLCQAWLATDRPAPPRVPALGMFEAWARVIAGILASADIPGFLENRAALYERADNETALVRTFLALWWEQHGTTPQPVAELVPVALAPEVGLDVEGRTVQAQRIRLGRLLGKIQDCVYRLEDSRRLRVEKAPTASDTGGIRWRLSECPEDSEGVPPIAHAHARARDRWGGQESSEPSEPSEEEPPWVRGEDDS